MGFFSRNKTENTPAISSAPPIQEPSPMTGGINMVKGNVSLSKGSAPVMMEKAGLIKCRATWMTGTDYDGYLLAVVLENGKRVQKDIAMFGAQGVPVMREYRSPQGGRLYHHGDVGRSGGATKEEVMDVTLASDILAVALVVYSAQSNGAGSFYRYKVGASIENGEGTQVTIDARDANANDGVYTVVPGVIINDPAGAVIRPTIQYSKGGENRPRFNLKTLEIEMDKGPRNDYK